ncbi:ABC transporter substrate-binding protein [Salinigranum rubrum]|uniref:ABC transporter substrate-binding protein n=2 Tax=Salinigranum rubrum TaxID=755307 RepID=A0A2I8VJE5_9EURY|nr:ABC transporter substrate-binding protein [Salinigranum rubrum]
MSERHTSRRANRSSRRRFLKLTGASAMLATSLAGCAGTEGGGSTATATDAPSGGGATQTESGGGGQTSTGTPTSSGPERVVFGQPAGISGKWDFLQPAVSQASELATQQINDAGGPLDAEFELLRRDTAVNPQQARQVVRQLVNNDRVPAINGLFSSEIVPLWDFIQELEVPIISPWPGSTFLDTRGGDRGTPEDLSDDEWLWRTVIGDTVHTAGAAKAMIDNDFTTLGVLNGTSAGERSWSDSFIAAFEDLGGTVAQRVEVSEGQSSYQSSLDRLFQTDFDAWALAVALTDATTVIRDWSNAGYGRQLLLEDGLMDADLIEAVGEQAEGAWIAAGSTQGPNYDSFLPAFQELGDADVHTWGVASYDATNVLALATHRAGEATPEAIEQSIGPVTREGGTAVSNFAEGKEALDAGEEINYEGAVTPVDFTEFGNVWGNVGVSTVTPDGFEEEFTVEADTLKESIADY